MAEQTINKPQTNIQTKEPSRMPDAATLLHASRLGISEDRAIMMDYWQSSLDKKCLIGIRENGEKLLVKSAEEYTSNILKFYKSKEEFIIMTENSIYIVNSSIPTKKIT